MYISIPVTGNQSTCGGCPSLSRILGPRGRLAPGYKVHFTQYTAPGYKVHYSTLYMGTRYTRVHCTLVQGTLQYTAPGDKVNYTLYLDRHCPGSTVAYLGVECDPDRGLGGDHVEPRQLGHWRLGQPEEW